jgi:signal transduction histidine kinase
MSGAMADGFKVDTRLFRELGELLVGRESTALAELIKNSYDADARRVAVTAHNLSNRENATISIVDNGIGMDEDAFRRGFLTIAARTKTGGDRTSKVFGRRFTGAKGVGRLAAHKLGSRVSISSNAWDGARPKNDADLRSSGGVVASLDWDKIETFQTLDTITSGISVKSLGDRVVSNAGTVIEISSLRRSWTEAMVGRFLREALTLTPIEDLILPPPSTFGGPLLFAHPRVRDNKTDSGFNVVLLGDFEGHELATRDDPASAIQLIEIDCNAGADLIRYGISPSRDFDRDGGKRIVETVKMSRVLQSPDDQYVGHGYLAFQARIYEAMGKSWNIARSGVRVYMEGFRVAPYADPSDDWLELKRDYTSRSGTGAIARIGEIFANTAQYDKEAAIIRPDSSYMGAVFLTHSGAPNLQMLINREGFLPGPTIDAVARIVRLGIDLATRVRAAAKISIPERPQEIQKKVIRAAREPTTDAPVGAAVRIETERLLEIVGRVRRALEKGDDEGAQRELKESHESIETLAHLAQEYGLERSLFRVLAALGTMVSGFSHEVGQLVPLASAVRSGVKTAKDELPAATARKIGLVKTLTNADNLLRAVERQASYLVDVSGSMGRRRRARLRFSERFTAAVAIVSKVAEDRQITIINDIPEDLKSPPMFPSELTMILANLLTNAVKAAGPGGRIRASGRETEDYVRVRIYNTGIAVSLRDADRWFKPFESTTTQADATLGQGMGLGLPIVRSILQDYGAEISFVKPIARYSTAIQMKFWRN